MKNINFKNLCRIKKNKLKFLIPIPLLYFVFLIFSCNGKYCWPADRVHHDSIHEIFIDYFASYKDGSYWVFEDSASKTIDTMFLSDYSRATVYHKKETCAFFDEVRYVLKCDMLCSSDILFFLHREYDNSIGFMGLTNCIPNDYYEFGYTSSSFNYGYPGMKPLQFDSLTINNKIYFDILKYKSQNTYSNVSDYRALFFAKGIGIVKILSEGKTLNLIDYEIKN